MNNFLSGTRNIICYLAFGIVAKIFASIEERNPIILLELDSNLEPSIAAISTRMIDRIFSGAVTRGPAQNEGKMSYTEFVWFLLAEEDKRGPTSIEYW